MKDNKKDRLKPHGSLMMMMKDITKVKQKINHNNHNLIIIQKRNFDIIIFNNLIFI